MLDLRLVRRALVVLTTAATVAGIAAAPAGATHFRAANLTWVTTTTTDQARYNLTLAFRRSYFTTNYGFTPNVGDTVAWSPANAGPFGFGDGGTATPSGTVVAVNDPDDFLIMQVGGNPPPAGAAFFEHTFTGAGPYVSDFTGCCTLSTLQNNHDQSYRAYSQVDFAHATGAPLSSVTPIVDFGNTGTYRYTIPALDPDNQTLTFRLATTGESGVIAQPAGLTVDSSTGKISWDTTATTPGLYQVAVVIEAHQTDPASAVSSSSLVTFLIRVSADTTNHPPAWDGSTPADMTPYNLVRGQALSVGLSATDPDPGQTVHIDNLGLPTGATVSTADGRPTGTSTFSWTPTQLGDYLVTFSAQDDQIPPGSAPSRTIAIHVVDQAPVAHLSAAPDSGPRGLAVAFDTSGTTDPDGTADLASYTLDYGDGSPVASGTGAPPTAFAHTYAAKGSYTATLTVTDSGGLGNSATAPISVTNTPPVAHLSASPASGPHDLVVTFDTTGTTDADGASDVAGYTLDFGDGGTASSTGLPPVYPMHTYTHKGTYTATLTVSDASATHDSATVTITVTNLAPVAHLVASPSSGEAPLGVAFSTSGTSDPDGAADVTSSTLSFGDGSPVVTTAGLPALSAAHTYTAAGSYTATLLVKDASGATSTSAQTITVSRAVTDLVADPSVLSLRSGSLMVPLRPVAHLKRHSTGAPLSGKTITFASPLGSPICTATTDATGTASCSGLIPLVQTLLGYNATFAGDATYQGSSASNVAISIHLTLF